MREHVEEAGERGIGVMEQPLADELGQMQRQRAVRPEHAEEPHFQSRWEAVRRPRQRRHRRGGEIERRLLREAHRLVGRPRRGAQARTGRKQALDPAQGLEEIMRERRKLNAAEECLGTSELGVTHGRRGRCHRTFSCIP